MAWVDIVASMTGQPRRIPQGIQERTVDLVRSRGRREDCWQRVSKHFEDYGDKQVLDKIIDDISWMFDKLYIITEMDEKFLKSDEIFFPHRLDSVYDFISVAKSSVEAGKPNGAIRVAFDHQAYACDTTCDTILSRLFSKAKEAKMDVSREVIGKSSKRERTTNVTFASGLKDLQRAIAKCEEEITMDMLHDDTGVSRW